MSLLYACDKAYSGSDVAFTIDGQALTQQVKPTDGWEAFSIMELGTLTINKVGNTTCSIEFGEKKGKALMNLKTVILAPSE